MGKIVMLMSVSVDGYFEGPNHELDWQSIDDELHQHFNDLLAASSAFIDGRVTYELMARYWPNADTDPASTTQMVEFARIWRDMPKFVFSSTLERADWNTTVVREIDGEYVAALKARFDGDLALGGADLAAQFIRLDLLDEIRLYVHPVVLGGGRQLFRPDPVPRPLGLLESRVFGSGVVLLRYGRSTAQTGEPMS